MAIDLALDTQTSAVQFKSEWIYFSCFAVIGTFECHADHPRFGGTHYFDADNMVVFPRTAIELRMAGQDPLIGSPNVAIFYNRGTEYERHKLIDDRDRCDYFQFQPKLIRDIMAVADPAAGDRIENRFAHTHTMINKDIFLAQRRLMSELTESVYSSRLKIDEVVIELLEGLLFQNRIGAKLGGGLKTKTERIHRELVYQVQKLFVTRLGEPLSLHTLAADLAVSPYHLSRVFRRQTGWSVHQAFEQLRLRTALERLGDYRSNLSQLAVELGYASHSHFGYAFRRQFGTPPSKWLR